MCFIPDKKWIRTQSAALFDWNKKPLLQNENKTLSGWLKKVIVSIFIQFVKLAAKYMNLIIYHIVAIPCFQFTASKKKKRAIVIFDTLAGIDFVF